MKTYLPTSTNISQVRREEGAVLIVALILLLVLTMLGISAMESTKLETKMAANTTNYNRAFQTAEAGLDESLDYYLDSDNKDEFGPMTATGICDSLDVKEDDSGAGKISQATRCVRKSNTEKQPNTNDQQLYYIVESTGYNSLASNSNSIQTKLVAGITLIGPNNNQLVTQY